jgi:hemerythrin-like domain-containing protein
MDLRESINQILSDKKAKREGLHVKHIARHILNSNNTLFPDETELVFNDFENLKRKITRILATDVKKKKNRRFVRVKNPKTGKFRRGVYKLKSR